MHIKSKIKGITSGTKKSDNMAGKGKGKSMHLYRMMSNDSDSTSSDEDQPKKLAFDPSKLFPIDIKPIDLPISHSKDSCLLCFAGYKRRVSWLLRKHCRDSPYCENTLIYMFKAGHEQEKYHQEHSTQDKEIEDRIKKLKEEAQELDDSDQVSSSTSMDECEEKDLIDLNDAK